MIARVSLGMFMLLAALQPLHAKTVAEWTPGGVVWHDVPEERSTRTHVYRPQKGSSHRTAKPLPAADNGDDGDRPQRKAPVSAKAPALSEGGPRPSISASAPPVVAFRGFAAGSIVIDTAGRALYYVRGGGSAYRYPIAVGKVGFTWTGTEHISRKASWPDWRPPEEMRERRPNLPEVMTGGIRNPLGAMALYLGNSLYRIHGTNDTSSIGRASSSGCFRMMNAHVLHLAGIAHVGTTVHVVSRLPGSGRAGSARAGSTVSNDE